MAAFYPQRRQGHLPLHPEPDLSAAAFGSNIEIGQCADEPFLERPNEGSDVPAAAIQVQHDIGDPLARTMIGELTPASGPERGEACRVKQILIARTRSCRIEGRMLQQPNLFRMLVPRYGRGELLHPRNGPGIVDQARGNLPADGAIEYGRRDRRGNHFHALS